MEHGEVRGQAGGCGLEGPDERQQERRELCERLDLERFDDRVVFVCGLDVSVGLYRRDLLLELDDGVEPEVGVLRRCRIADGQDERRREDDIVEQRVQRGQYALKSVRPVERNPPAGP